MNNNDSLPEPATVMLYTWGIHINEWKRLGFNTSGFREIVIVKLLSKHIKMAVKRLYGSILAVKCL